MQAEWQSFWNDEAGATMVEYGLVVALIAVMISAGASAFGISVNDNLFMLAAAIVGSL